MTDYGGNLSDSTEAIGVYHVLYHDGQYGSSGTNPNPRTIIGIKPDGTLMLYALDGRQPGFSEGLGLTDTARHLVALGCSTVVNMDGGGSTVIAVREGASIPGPLPRTPLREVHRGNHHGLFPGLRWAQALPRRSTCTLIPVSPWPCPERRFS